ncbi:hypothetical protein D041_0495B, partial [Vibrio parahaemolyticus EKP-008]
LYRWLRYQFSHHQHQTAQHLHELALLFGQQGQHAYVQHLWFQSALE